MAEIQDIENFLSTNIPESFLCSADVIFPEVLDSLTPKEIESISPAVRSRLIEFAAGRRIAKNILKRLGHDTAHDLISNVDGQPNWPQGFIGSITHKGNICAAVVGPKSKNNSFGLDIENWKPRDLKISDSVLTSAECELLKTSDVFLDEKIINLFLSAKESFFKYQFPLTGLRLDFHDIELKFDFKMNDYYVSSTRSTKLISYNLLANSKGKFFIGETYICTFCTSSSSKNG